MPKVMPDMLAALKEAVPLPPHMKQQMPDLVPKGIDSLLTKMLALVSPTLCLRWKLA